MLPQARARATQLGHRGAMFPWRTISGEEASAYYVAGTAQYHINADIMYALRKYVQATGDEQFLERCGAEMLVETARLWLDLGFYSDIKGGKFCINAVTGPDEYNTVVNNNAYTNLMAEENLRYAAQTVETLRSSDPDAYRALVEKTGLQPSEVEAWLQAANSMYVPYDEKLKIIPQDDSFLEGEPWDFQNTPQDHYPLLLFYHPLNIYRKQVIKQTDVVLAMFLLGGAFSLEAKKRNFEFYDPLTTGDSSLSSCVEAIIAAQIGDTEKAIRYGMAALLMDLADVGGNVKDGCHIASMGGTWMMLAYGLGGVRDGDGVLSFWPRRAPDDGDTQGWVGPARGEVQSRPHVRTICQLSPPGTHSSDIRDDEPAAEPRANLEHGAVEGCTRRPTAPRDRRAPSRCVEMGLGALFYEQSQSGTKADQRPVGDRGNLRDVPGSFGKTPLPGAGPGVLRVAG